MIIEICCSSIQSAINAQIGGANRIELCTELSVGGLTPSYGMISEVLSQIQIPVFVLIRPRSGNFCYSEYDSSAMKEDVKMCKELGCAGIVSGFLTNDNLINIDKTAELIELSRPLQFTFHRAFDRVLNPIKSLEQLVDLGADRILTSGQQNSALDGLDLLIRLKEKADSKLKILAGGGINSTNIHLFLKNGFDEIHASASTLIQEQKAERISMNSPKFFDETKLFESDEQEIKRMVNQLVR